MVEQLNTKLEEHGLLQVVYVSDAVYQLGNKFACTAEKEEFLRVLIAFFSARLGAEEDAAAAIREWPEVMKWRLRRVAFTHLMGDNEIKILKEQVLQAQTYAPVRSAARALVAVAEDVLA